MEGENMELPKVILELMDEAEYLLTSTRMDLLDAVHHPYMGAEERQRLPETIDRISLMLAEAKIRLLA